MSNRTKTSRRAFFAAIARPGAAAQPPEVTSADRFFRHYTPTQPRLNSAHWSFSIGGQVRIPLSWSYDDLRSLPQAEMPCTLVCASNPPGGERIGHAVWQGVPLAALLDAVTTSTMAAFARLESAGGGRTVVPQSALRAGLLATHMNGVPLPHEQGFPARLIIPGLYEHKQPRWIERVELWDSPGPGGVWEQRGWTAEIRPTSAFSAVRLWRANTSPVQLNGYAFAGTHRIRSVEISVDGGPWVGAEVGTSAPNVWTRWATSWPASGSGDYQMRVRATDESGRVQSEAPADRFRHHSSGLHQIVVRVGRSV